MNICLRENLNQVDLLSPSVNKITQQEYYAKQRGQINLDKLNAELIAEGFTPMKTKFQTEKDKLRDSITAAAKKAKSFEEFSRLLQTESNILIKDHRGRFSYLLPDREKYISARTLGTSFDREHLLTLFESNAITAAKEKKQWSVADPIAVLYIKSNLRLVVNLQDCVKAQQSRAYTQKVKISNLQQMANTIVYVQQHGYDSYDDLKKARDELSAKMSDARNTAKSTDADLKLLNEKIHYLLSIRRLTTTCSGFALASAAILMAGAKPIPSAGCCTAQTAEARCMSIVLEMENVSQTFPALAMEKSLLAANAPADTG